MINGAEEIIGGISGRHLHPVLLAQSQTKESFGFIMISYNLGSGSDVNPDKNSRKFFDFLFLKGPRIYECARLNQDLRFTLNIDSALRAFTENRYDTQVHLYRASEEIIHRFRSTFYYEPCLKVHIEALTKKQIVTLLKTSRCQQGIVECNEFTKPKPNIHLIEIQSSSQISEFEPSLKHGRLLLYDIAKNEEIIRERYSTCAIPTNFTKQRAGKINVGMSIPPAFGGTKIVDNSWSGTSNAGAQVIRHENGLIPASPKPAQEIQPPASAAHIRIINQTTAQDRAIEMPSDDRHAIEADEYTMFIRQILNSPMSKDEKNERITPQDNFIRLDDTPESAQHESCDKGIIANPVPEIIPLKKKRKRQKPSSRRVVQDATGRVTGGESSTTGNSPPSFTSTSRRPSSFQSTEYVYLFERLFRSFRQQLFESVGAKCEEIIKQAEQKVRFLVPEFDCHALKEETVLSLFDLIEEIIEQASLFRRSKLRRAAVTLISDLYNKQYELLEKHHDIDAIERTYYRLRK